MTRLPLSLACWNYDRVQAIADGRVQPDGIALNLQTLEVEETFFRMLRHREFDAAEMSLSSYCVTLGRGDSPFVAIPVFPSRLFRHSCIFVGADSSIDTPADLAGKRIGVPEYQMTAPVWIRGILADEYGVAPDSPIYVTGGEEQPGRDEKLKLDLPARFRIERLGAGDTLARALAEGRIDALHTARTPSTFYTRPDRLRRLFPDFVTVEQDYYRRTGIFPIMHVVAVRREVYEAHRWIARALYKAFDQAKALVQEELRVTASLKTMLPWQIAAVEQATALLGDDWWPYGVDANAHALDTFLRYHHDQGLSPRKLDVAELFAPECFESFRI